LRPAPRWLRRWIWWLTVRGELGIPIVLFTYVNPVLRMGVGDFVRRAAEAGVDGVLLLDLPIEESA
jgi:tryptophan synthase alpha chain